MAILLDGMVEAVVVTDMEEVVLFASRTAGDVLGYPQEELTGANLLDLAGLGEGLEGLGAPGQEGRQDARIRGKDGRYRNVSVCASPLLSPGGQVTGTVRLFHDMTDATRARGQANTQREFADRLLQAVPMIVLVTDARGHVLRSNAFAQARTGLSPEELADRDWLGALVPQVDRQRVREGLSQAFAPEGPQDYEDETGLVTAEGAGVCIEWSVSLLHGPKGLAGGLLILGKDVSGLRAQQAALAQRTKTETVGRLADGIADDFSNQLAAIQSYSDMLAGELPADSAGVRIVRKIKQASEVSVGLMNRLMGLTQRSVPQRVLDVSRVVEEMADELSRIVGEGIELSMDLSKTPTLAKLDAGEFELVVTSLVANACAAMPTGGQLTIETASVDLNAQLPGAGEGPSGPYVMLAVTEIPHDAEGSGKRNDCQCPRGTASGDEGVNLGLAVVHEFVRSNGGNICVTSQPTLGTTLAMYLPGAVPQDETLPREAPVEDPAPREGGTILIAEDHGQMRDLLVGFLRESGYEVLAARNGEEALRLARELSDGLDLLVTDIVMPGMSGGALAQEVARLWPDAQILYISAYGEHTISRYGIPLANGNLLRKPFRRLDLVRMVRMLLRPQSRPLSEY